MAAKKTVLIVDDHPLFREGIKTILKTDSSYEVVGEAGGGREALQLARKLKPAIVILDIGLPDQPGFEVIGQIKHDLPNVAILIVTMHSRVDYLAKAFELGAAGYVVKESAAERLLEGMETVLKGDYYLDTSVSHQVVQKLLKEPKKGEKIIDAGYSTLTPREQEIMVLLAEGIPSKEIAEKLFISTKTVENHRSSIFRKLNIHSTIDLVRYAVKLGLIDTDLWKT